MIDQLKKVKETTSRSRRHMSDPTTSDFQLLGEGPRQSLIGIVHEKDDRPALVTTSEGKITQIFHITLSSTTDSIGVTFWDRVAEHGRIKVGETVELQGLTLKAQKPSFQEFGPLAANFSKQATLVVKPAGARGVNFLTKPLRIPRTLTAPSKSQSSVSQSPPVVSKRARESYVCPNCPDGDRRWCSAVPGVEHDKICDICGLAVRGRKICPDTGVEH